MEHSRRPWLASAASLAVVGCVSQAPPDGDPPPPDCRPPVLFGHRGTPLFRPENTMPAFRYAVEEGGDGIEVDVRVTLDGAIVAMHDARTGRTTDDAADRPVSELTLAEIKALDAGSWFDARYAGTEVPTLDEIAAAFPPDVLLLLDLKGEGIGPAVVDAVERLGIAERSLVSSFDEALLASVHAALPDVPVLYYLDAMGEMSRGAETGAAYLRIPEPIEDDPAFMDEVIAAGYRPAVSGRYIRWDGCLGLVNNMHRTVERRVERRPADCAEKTSPAD
ncbi:MAG: glycerophosphodiester phosphodiesterase family protein [Myxococcota bacterium]